MRAWREAWGPAAASRAAWLALVMLAAALRTWRAWFFGAVAVAGVGVRMGWPLVVDGATWLMAVLLVVLVWKGPGWWRDA